MSGIVFFGGGAGPFLLSISGFFVFSFFVTLFCLVPCGRLSWLLVSFWAHVNIVHRIAWYRIVRGGDARGMSYVLQKQYNV